jgi:hypothetical protein
MASCSPRSGQVVMKALIAASQAPVRARARSRTARALASPRVVEAPISVAEGQGGGSSRGTARALPVAGAGACSTAGAAVAGESACSTLGAAIADRSKPGGGVLAHATGGRAPREPVERVNGAVARGQGGLGMGQGGSGHHGGKAEAEDQEESRHARETLGGVES